MSKHRICKYKKDNYTCHYSIFPEIKLCRFHYVSSIKSQNIIPYENTDDSNSISCPLLIPDLFNIVLKYLPFDKVDNYNLVKLYPNLYSYQKYLRDFDKNKDQIFESCRLQILRAFKLLSDDDSGEISRPELIEDLINDIIIKYQRLGYYGCTLQLINYDDIILKIDPKNELYFGDYDIKIFSEYADNGTYYIGFEFLGSDIPIFSVYPRSLFDKSQISEFWDLMFIIFERYW